MVDPVQERFLAALRAAAERRLGAGHRCTAALARAASDADPNHAAAAHEELRRLDPAVLEELTRDAHKALREDPAAIMERWRGPGGVTRPN